MKRKGITYTYDTGQISHFTLRRVEGDCKINPERTTLVGVFCQTCEFYNGIRTSDEGKKFVVCTNPENKDDDADSRWLRHKICEEIHINALRALDY